LFVLIMRVMIALPILAVAYRISVCVLHGPNPAWGVQTKLKPKRPQPDAGAAKRRSSARELAAIEKYLLKSAEAAPRVKVLDGAERTKIATDYPDTFIGDALLMEALGTADHEFFDGLITQLAQASSRGGKVDERALNFMLSVVKGIKPGDQIEAMLAAQMAAIHVSVLTLAGRLAHVEEIPQQDSCERAFNKLARTFATQTEALKRYRTGGEQKVTVQHVSVSEGGRAIVGNVTHAAGEAAPLSTLAEPEQAPMVLVGELERAPLLLETGRKAPVRRRRKDVGRSSA
jgi:hypothetical protein